MSVKVIIVEKGEIKTKEGGKDWVELTDQDDRPHRIFSSIQKADETWVHLDKEIDMLRSKIEDGTIIGLALQLTKEKKGTYWNVIKVEEVKDVFQKQATEKVADKEYDQTSASIEAQVCLKCACEIAKETDNIDTILQHAEKMRQWISKVNQGVSPTVANAPQPTKSNSSPVAEPTNDNLPEEAIKPASQTDKVNKEWLKETLQIIHWRESTALSWVKSQLKVEGKDLIEVLNSLDRDKLKGFVEHISAMRDSAGQ